MEQEEAATKPTKSHFKAFSDQNTSRKRRAIKNPRRARKTNISNALSVSALCFLATLRHLKTIEFKIYLYSSSEKINFLQKNLMAKKSIILFCIFIVKTSFCQFYGGEKNDKGISFCQINNNFFLTGTTRNFGSGSEDFLIIKVDKNLKSVWHKEWGGEHHDITNQIIKTSDNNFVIIGNSWDAPGGRTNVVISKYDSLGNNLWMKYYGDKEDDHASKIIETADHGFLITGTNRSKGKLGAAFLIKTDLNGNIEWKRFYDTENKDIGMSVIFSSDSTLFVLINSNSFVGKIANSSEYLSEKPSQGTLIKTDKDGKEMWRKNYNEKKHSFIKDIVFDGRQYFYIIGSTLNHTNGSFDISLRKIDSRGNTVWKNTYGKEGYEYGNSIDINSNGELLLTGTSNSFSENKKPDIYVVKINPYGVKIWEKTYGGNNSDYGNYGRFLSNNNIAIFGSSKSKKGTSLDLYFFESNQSGKVIKTLTKTD